MSAAAREACAQFRLGSRIINETGIADLVNDDRTAAEIEILSREILKPNEITDTKKGPTNCEACDGKPSVDRSFGKGVQIYSGSQEMRLLNAEAPADIAKLPNARRRTTAALDDELLVLHDGPRTASRPRPPHAASQA